MSEVARTVEIDGGIVVGHDGSKCAQEALVWAGRLAARADVELHVVRAWSMTSAPQPASWTAGYIPPLPEWEQQQKLLVEYEADLVRTNEMCATLASFGLLEPFTMQARPNEGTPLSLSGMGRVSEQKLTALEAEQIKTLMSKGYLQAVYAHIASLGNFQRLLDRRASLAARQGQQA